MVIRGKKSILIVFYQITEEVFHFREHTFLQEKKRNNAETRFLNDMIAFVWFF